MKKTFQRVVAVVMCAAMLSMSSCIGSFKLSNRLLSWNENVGNKFMNELVFFAFWVLPVYEVCILADVLVLNSIEFWSGDNPMAQGEKVIEGTDGNYLVKCDGKGYDVISCNDGSSVRLDFDVESQTWSYTAGETTTTLFTFVDDSHVKLPVDGGKDWQIFEVSEAGLLAYQQMAMPAFAAK